MHYMYPMTHGKCQDVYMVNMGSLRPLIMYTLHVTMLGKLNRRLIRDMFNGLTIVKI